MAEKEKDKQEEVKATKESKEEEKPNKEIEPPKFARLTEGIITPKDKKNLEELLKELNKK